MYGARAIIRIIHKRVVAARRLRRKPCEARRQNSRKTRAQASNAVLGMDFPSVVKLFFPRHGTRAASHRRAFVR